MNVPEAQNARATSLLAIETPRTIAEIQQILRDAKGCKVRVVGAQHSTENAIYGQRPDRLVVVSMTRFDDIRFVDNRRPADHPNRGKSWVRVEAGVHIAEQPYVHPVPAEHAQLRRWLARHGVALNLVGGVAHQTVVGFLSTGSSGGSWYHSLHDMVVEIELVDGKGVHRTVRRHAEDEAERELFAAAGVSLGLLGIIVAVTLEVDDDYHVVGTESFGSIARVPAAERGDLVTTFCREAEYGRLIWWSQKDLLQRWACQRIVPRGDAAPIPYMPVGVNDLAGQLRAGLIMTLVGNLATLENVRGIPAKLAEARMPEYFRLLAAQGALRPPHERATPIEVLQRSPHYHWTQSRHGPPRRIRAGGPRDEGELVKLVVELSGALSGLDPKPFERLVERLLITAADEALKRLLYLADGGGPTERPEALRAALDAYGNIVSGMLKPDRDVGAIGVGRPPWQALEKALQILFDEPDMRLVEFADHFGEAIAALMLPIQREPQSPVHEKAAWLVHAFARAAVYAEVPDMVEGFFADVLGTTTGFYDRALDGLAVDRRINHHLVQTKFSEIWVKSSDAPRALRLLTEYMKSADQAEDPAFEGPLGALRGALAELGATPGGGDPHDALGSFHATLARASPPRFSRQGVYSHEIYGGKANDTFLLHPGHGAACECEGRCACERNWVRINLFWFAYNEATPRAYFYQFWKLLEGVEHRCHWGKEMPAAPRWDDAFRRNIEAFLEQRRAMDPDGLFYTDYWKQMLEG